MLYQNGMVILLIILFLLLSLKVNEEITDHGCDEHCKIYECDPGLVIDIEFLECETVMYNESVWEII